MDYLNKLAEKFKDLPGVGPRQSKRFVFALLQKNNDYLAELGSMIINLKKNITICATCFRFFTGKQTTCSICSDTNRDQSMLMIVCKDTDLESVEKSGVYKGKYIVAGGTVPILEKNPELKIRAAEIQHAVKTLCEKGVLKEIIISMSSNPEGENTEQVIRALLREFVEKYHITVSILGKGLSTGTELEYSDADTIRNALLNRKQNGASH